MMLEWVSTIRRDNESGRMEIIKDRLIISRRATPYEVAYWPKIHYYL